ncbi:transporter substrate-binding domain-containing protein [Echinicola jeungdonensis]|uniref:Transporter substrate-binding domain-containing protein n=1 Tax=Echinicola jeungdonensis TaxID=709343 RepID=A0ABV5J3I6_9BACT|nr:transporter substrate-binding domain-containing protein [Echinicola jeungdonensis]MDN3668237.1 transporter substrate-binding domain-containing protein [Echinicola jeungdonensis]
MKRLLTIILAITFLTGCGSSSDEKNKLKPGSSISRDLPEIQKEGTLKVLVNYSSTSYFLYRGKPMGFEYELLQRLAKDLDLNLELVVVENLDSVFQYINNGKADMIAHGMTITTERKEKVDFTNYLYLTSQVLVQKKPDNWRNISWANTQRHLIHDAIDLIGDTVSVRENSSYMDRINNLSMELGGKIYIDTLSGTLSTEEIMKKVADGEIKYTVADKNLAKVSAVNYPILDITVPLSLSQRIGWAVRKNSPELLASVNEWIAKEKKKVPYYVIYNRYFKNKRDFKRRIKSEFMSLNGNQISKYDDIIKKYAENLGWDWRLVASLIYQESRFKNNAKSWAGAKGLMQIMPRTAESLGIKNPNSPEQSVKGGTLYLKKIYNRLDGINDSTQRIKFTMASYNCGYSHVKDARFLAKQENLNPNLWDGHVEKMVMALSYPKNYNKEGVHYGYVRGIEPVTYVGQIFKRYDHYVKFIEE